MGKVTPWELCKKMKFAHTNKWYIHNPGPVFENETYKLHRNFDIEMDKLISARQSYLIIIIVKERELTKL